MERLLADRLPARHAGIALDLGVSSMQIDQPERGFPFRADGPLDMRMEGPVAEGRPTAAAVVHSLPEAELAHIIYRYGEERRPRPVARALGAAHAPKSPARHPNR